jgi:hypothetical protein
VPELNDALGGRASLVDAVDRLLDRGAVLTGEAMLSLAGVDLVYLGLNLVIGSVETFRRQSAAAAMPAAKLGAAPLDSGPAERPSLATHSAPVPRSTPTFSQDWGRERREENGPGASPALPGEAGTFRQLPPAAEMGDEGGRQETQAPEAGLARLVLTLVELLRELLERQAVRRMEGEGLADDDIERMGRALIDLEQKMAELRAVFGLSEADLRLDLGPLGPLL